MSRRVLFTTKRDGVHRDHAEATCGGGRRLFVETHQIAFDDTHPRETQSFRQVELVQIAHIASVASDDLQPDDIATSDARKVDLPTSLSPGFIAVIDDPDDTVS
jgi:hypothetical protein